MRFYQKSTHSVSHCFFPFLKLLCWRTVDRFENRDEERSGESAKERRSGFFSLSGISPSPTVAANLRAEGESKAARLHSFFSSVFASLFRQREEEQEEEGIAEEKDFMASKRQELVLQQQKGGLPPVGKQKAVAVAADAKNRRALEDIGNLVNVRVVEG
ncbi:hypothetical protein ZIOFF_023425 [Zingiber officinale]|uniref:Uncharacterized protein n=1 Tax=Zingiber officinale TaxID=94328 RepID=A0A8J5GUM4_ZINOF|nr:hypothetical protein ZIOFF_023425 [Zingiber officinale]